MNTIEHTSFIYTLLVIMFLISGINKISTFNTTVDSLKQKIQSIFNWQETISSNIYYAIIIMIILLEIIAPIIIINYAITNQYKKEAYYSAIALVGFTIIATLVYHFPDFSNYKKSLAFWANISLIGGLLLLAKTIRKNEA